MLWLYEQGHFWFGYLGYIMNKGQHMRIKQNYIVSTMDLLLFVTNLLKTTENILLYNIKAENPDFSHLKIPLLYQELMKPRLKHFTLVYIFCQRSYINTIIYYYIKIEIILLQTEKANNRPKIFWREFRVQILCN